MTVACPKCTTPLREGARFCDTCGSPASPVSPLSPGTGGGGPAPGLPPRYEVLKFLGRGGMGRVYLCRDTDLDVEVAIKVLPADVAADEDALVQIQREARAVAKFRECPGILSLYGFERHGDSRYLVMDFASGGSLHDRLKKEGRLPEAECRRLGAEVADALAFAHEMKVLHRDIKPANVLLDGKGRVKVADFGIAKVMADTSARMSMMTVAGTPIYMAPEIVLQKKVDHRADLYSLGCMLYEMSTGERPFQGAYHEIMAAKMLAGAAAPDPREKNPDLGEDFAACVQRLLNPDPADRFPDAAACAMALRTGTGHPASSAAEGIHGTFPPSVLPAGPAGLLPKSEAVRSRPSRVPLFVAVLAATTLGAGAWALFGRSSEAPKSAGDPPAKSPDRSAKVAALDLRPPALISAAPGAPSPKDGSGEGPASSARDEASGAAPPPPPAPETAPGLLVVTDPPGATITVDGLEKGVAGKEGLLLADLDPAEEYTVTVLLEDYDISPRKRVRWSRGERKNLDFVLVRSKGFLRIECGPAGASVRAERPGAPPLDFALAEDGTLGPIPIEVGEWTVTLSKKGFDPWIGSAKVIGDRTAKVTASLKERDGTLAVSSDPPGAEVYLGDILLGETPFSGGPLPAGSHTFRLVHPDTEEVTVEAVIRGELELSLGRVHLPVLAILDLSGLPEGVTAEVEGKAVSGTLRRKAGEVGILWKRAKCSSQTGKVALLSGNTTRPIVPDKWTVIPGRLVLSELPADVVVTVDGTKVNRSGSTLDVQPGTHTVGLSRTGFRLVAAQSVTVDADQDVPLSNPSWVVLVTMMPAVPGLPPPPESVLAAQKALATIPEGFVRADDGRIWCEKDGAEMVLVPAGEFNMGSDDGLDDERPAHLVFVSSYLIDRHEVTVGQYKRFSPSTGGGSPGLGDLHPIVNVNWNEATAFANWAGKRLPTEAEWEKAARGTDGRKYPWGDQEPTGVRANYSGPGQGRTTAAGSLPAGESPYGCLDLAGNVWEWCSDYYEEKYYANSTARDPQGGSFSPFRVSRGGSYGGDRMSLRCTARRALKPLYCNINYGLRCVRSLP